MNPGQSREGVRIKFCGLQHPAEIDAAVDLGADYVGMVFVQGSRRACDVDEMQRYWSTKVVSGVKRVGVFRDARAHDINSIIERCRLDYVQLHGHEIRDFPGALKKPVIRTIRLGSQAGTETESKGERTSGTQQRVPRTSGHTAAEAARDALRVTNVAAVLLDAQDAAGRSGGLGVAIDTAVLDEFFRGFTDPSMIFLSGGLTPDNVANKMRRYGAGAVDVSSGIEKPGGGKDPERMRAFVAAVRSVEGTT